MGCPFMISIGQRGNPPRPVYLAHVPSLEAVVELSFPRQVFTTLLCADAEGAAVELVSRSVDHLIDGGCRGFSAWGPDCERVHDIFDETLCDPDTGRALPFISTTWHTEDSLEEAIWFVLHRLNQEGALADNYATVVLTVGDAEWRTQAEQALKHPDV